MTAGTQWSNPENTCWLNTDQMLCMMANRWPIHWLLVLLTRLCMNTRHNGKKFMALIYIISCTKYTFWNSVSAWFNFSSPNHQL